MARTRAKFKMINDPTFIGLTDVPPTYLGTGGKVLKSRTNESGLDFSEEGGGGIAEVITDLSVTGDGTADAPITLVNDEESPGNSQYYGTNAEGEKGYHSLPSGISIGDWDEDISFDFNDVEAGVAQTWILDIKASFAYKILSVVLQSDSTMDDVEVQINDVPVTWAGSITNIDVTTSILETAAVGTNSVAVGNIVKLVTSGTDGTPTLIRGKLKIQRN